MKKSITIAVASGKGGTGKTTVSTSLVCAAAEAGYEATYLDCDVEEPNGHLFLKPRLEHRFPVGIPVPVVDEEKCTGCGACGEICQYSAIVCLNKTVLTFDKMCHGCGGCALACPAGAITEKEREIGVIEKGYAGNSVFAHGRLNVGEIMGPPLIKAVGSIGRGSELRIIDVPPGTSCPVIASIKGVDYVLLVTEPTPFGIYDLDLAIDMVRELELPFAVVVNRSRRDQIMARDYCKKKNVKIMAELADDRKVAESYSRGELPYFDVPGYRKGMDELLISVLKEARE
jgi:MinD superfamily P-loop ATPase